MSLKIVVLAKQVPDTRNVGKDAMNADGTITKQGPVGYWYFGDDVTLTSGSFDSATGVVSYEGEFAGAPYTVVLTPITK